MDLNNYTPTELLKFKNDLNQNYNELKENILQRVDNIENLKNEINEFALEMNYVEELYNKIIEELQNRK